MSWIADVYSAVQKIILIEERLDNLTDKVSTMSSAQVEFDRRLIRMEAKFELLERMASAQRRSPKELEE